ncbi:hypothetical protein [Lewinella sp. IMCC34183]|uniref:hypothetical protein n=1 Tax=Lewinella sp. IMCC34183 TaxID=2248762 RepID=UPI00130057E5|nr:hypothetical protein [Lewinella sp. IMCC34183]
MHSLIKFRRTGTPEQFAARLNVSRSQLFKLLAELRDLGAPLHFCHQRQTYAYYESVELKLGFVAVEQPERKSSATPLHEATVVTLPLPRAARSSAFS